MKTQLNFLKSLKREKNFLQIKNNRITGTNGVYILSAPFVFPFECFPIVDKFIEAIDLIEEKYEFKLINNRLQLKTDKIKIFIECFSENLELNDKIGENRIILKKPILNTIKKLHKFIDKNSEKHWSKGILFTKKFLYVTNNRILIQYFCPLSISKNFILPLETIEEIVRINIEPNAIISDENTTTFVYPNDYWLKSAIIDETWPEIESIFETHYNSENMEIIASDFFMDLKKTIPFLEENRKIILNENEIKTHEHDEIGIKIQMKKTKKGKYNIDDLLLLEKVATKINFKAYPEPCSFLGENLRGLLTGSL